MAPGPQLRQTDRTRLRRKSERGSFDRAAANAILDEAYLAHVGFVADGQPFVLPMTYGRVDDLLYLHGAAANGMLKAAVGTEVCVTVTLLDGLVLARSAFHHSMNYRSVVLLGRAEKVTDDAEKERALVAVVDHMVPGRGAEARPSTAEERRATAVLRLPIAEGSVKVRDEGAVDEPGDLALPVWAGSVPLQIVPGLPVPNADLDPSLGSTPPAVPIRATTGVVRLRG